MRGDIVLASRLTVGVLLLVVAMSGAAAASTGDENVTVGFGLALTGEPLTSGTPVETTAVDSAPACQLSVPAGVGGIAVLDAAVAKGCINSYRTGYRQHYGLVIACINDVCDGPVRGPLPCVPEPPHWTCALGLDPTSFWDSPIGAFSASDGSTFQAAYGIRIQT